MENQNIIHVRLREPADGLQQDYYFGSLAAIYDVLPEAALGIKYDYLICCFAKRGHVYENPKCVIKRATIHRKKWKTKN